jgi:AcrR family transcriptional regulator
MALADSDTVVCNEYSMEPGMMAVKRKRGYDSAQRLARAAETRTAVLDAAERLFLSRGYAATTVASIAGAARVSVETIYKAFNGKPGLVRAIRKRGLAGRGPVHAERRSDSMRMAEENPRQIIANWGVLAAEVAPRVSPILLLVRDAAVTDAEMATLRGEMDDDRRRRMTRNARHLQSAGHLRPGMPLREAVDILWTYSSPELYELLVRRRGWSASRYGRFIADAMTAALLPPEQARGATAPRG